MPKLRIAALLAVAALGVSACGDDPNESNPGVSENQVEGATVETNPTTLGSQGQTEPDVTQTTEGGVTTETETQP